jgi:hypothetical protein
MIGSLAVCVLALLNQKRRAKRMAIAAMTMATNVTESIDMNLQESFRATVLVLPVITLSTLQEDAR